MSAFEMDLIARYKERARAEGDCADTTHDQELKALRKKLDECVAERDCARRETAKKDAALHKMRSACERKDRELVALRLQVRGVEVHDVDAGVSVIEELDRGARRCGAACEAHAARAGCTYARAGSAGGGERSTKRRVRGDSQPCGARLTPR